MKVIFGYHADLNERRHIPLYPCLKLIQGRKVVSIISKDGYGFARVAVGDTLRITRLDEIRCFIFPTQEDAENPQNLWDENFLAQHEVEQDSLKTVGLAIFWLIQPLD